MAHALSMREAATGAAEVKPLAFATTTLAVENIDPAMPAKALPAASTTAGSTMPTAIPARWASQPAPTGARSAASESAISQASLQARWRRQDCADLALPPGRRSRYLSVAAHLPEQGCARAGEACIAATTGE